jgi:hypothetical protein
LPRQSLHCAATCAPDDKHRQPALLSARAKLSAQAKFSTVRRGTVMIVGKVASFVGKALMTQ